MTTVVDAAAGQPWPIAAQAVMAAAGPRYKMKSDDDLANLDS